MNSWLDTLRDKGADLYVVEWEGMRGIQVRTVWGEDAAKRMVRILKNRGLKACYGKADA